MLIPGWKNRIMTTCMGLLILICLLTLIHWGVKAITVKIPRLYNYSLIKMALASTPPRKRWEESSQKYSYRLGQALSF